MSETKADVIVIGAGIIGATCAWRLAQAGLKVTVLERTAPCSGASQAALGVLSFHVKPEAPAEFQQLCRHSSRHYPAIIEELAEAVGERPDYRAGGQLVVALRESDLGDLDAAYAANVERGVPVERASAEDCRLFEPGLNPNNYGALFFPEDAWVDNTTLTFAIARAAEQRGVAFERATVEAVETESGRVTGVRADSVLHPAAWVVVAAGAWSGRIRGVPPLPVRPVRGQALAVAGQPVRRVAMSARGYVVPKGKEQTLVGATVEEAGFDQSTTLGGLGEVAAAGLELAPALEEREFLGAWAGLRPGTPDGLPFIGPFEQLPNLIAATGHFRNGILLAPLTAELVRAVVIGQKPPLDLQPLRPNRPSIRPTPHADKE